MDKELLLIETSTQIESLLAVLEARAGLIVDNISVELMDDGKKFISISAQPSPGTNWYRGHSK
jgi:hypothetical protein